MQENHPSGYVPSVMISSTFTDLKEHRAELINALHRLGLFADVMENDGARLVDVIRSSLQKVRDSVAYIGIISHRYGEVDDVSGLSITELEFEEAQRLHRPILLFVMGDDHDVKKWGVELDSAKREKLDAFRERAKKLRVCAGFNSLEQFKDQIAPSLHELCGHLNSAPAEKTTSIPTPPACFG